MGASSRRRSRASLAAPCERGMRFGEQASSGDGSGSFTVYAADSIDQIAASARALLSDIVAARVGARAYLGAGVRLRSGLVDEQGQLAAAGLLQVRGRQGAVQARAGCVAVARARRFRRGVRYQQRRCQRRVPHAWLQRWRRGKFAVRRVWWRQYVRRRWVACRDEEFEMPRRRNGFGFVRSGARAREAASGGQPREAFRDAGARGKRPTRFARSTTLTAWCIARATPKFSQKVICV